MARDNPCFDHAERLFSRTNTCQLAPPGVLLPSSPPTCSPVPGAGVSMKQEAESRLSGSQTLTSQLLETLGKAIVSEQFKGRSLPNEAEIAARYGASRSVTREAVKMLT